MGMIDQKKINEIKEFFLDLIFPKFCVGCGLEGEWVCPKCQNEVIRVITQVCPDCGKISPAGRYCLKCRKKHRLYGVVVAAYYEEGPIKEAIHNLKYNNVLELKEFLGNLMVAALKENIDDIGHGFMMVAVPMHYLRKAQRGYNQAEILADFVAKQLKIEKIFKIIKKIRNTKSQVSKSGKKRRENLKNSFKIIDNFSLKKVAGRTLVIVDDVTTTGTTLEECARVLKSAGAKRVWGLVVARG